MVRIGGQPWRARTAALGICPLAIRNEDTMSAFAVRTVFLAVTIALQSAIALADSAPNLDVGPSCDVAAQGAVVIGRDKEACLADERAAQDTLKKGWSAYTGADKTQCVGLVRSGGPASYVELLSCLEIMQGSKAIRATDELAGPLTAQSNSASTPSTATDRMPSIAPSEPNGTAGGRIPSVFRNGEDRPHLSSQRCWARRCR
jgi:hypothetical protein